MEKWSNASAIAIARFLFLSFLLSLLQFRKQYQEASSTKTSLKMRLLCKISIVCVVFLLVLSLTEARKRNKHSKAMVLRQKETNAVNFIRLSVMRVIYGIATRVGLGEQISEALNGVFVPPGVEDYDYDREGFDLFDDDYDY